MPLNESLSDGEFSFVEGLTTFRLSYSRVESESLGFPVFNIGDISVSDPELDLRQLQADMERFVKATVQSNQNQALVQCRMTSADKHGLICLESLGFRFRELTQHPHIEKGKLTPPILPDAAQFEVIEVEALASVQELAYKYEDSFPIGRFQREIQVSDSAIRRRFRNWILDSSSNSAKKLLSIQHISSGESAALFLVRKDDGGRFFWELTAINPVFASRSLSKMFFYMIAEILLSSGRSISSNFSSENVKLFKTYLDLGFRLGTPSVAMHLWIRL